MNEEYQCIKGGKETQCVEVNLKRIILENGAEPGGCGAGRSGIYKSPFLDLFIQMKEQREAGLCRTIVLSILTLT